MRLDHEFTVSAPVDQVWQALLDPQRVAPCMPGASLTSVDGDTFKGSVKVKLGPVNLLYKGSGEFQEKDEQSRRLVIEASGKDARGAGTASATVTVTLTAEGDGTKGTVATDLNVTGRPAQFGRGMISDVGGKILDSFSDSLAAELGATTSSQGSSSQSSPREATGTDSSSTSPADSGPAVEQPMGTAQEQRPPLHAVPDSSGSSNAEAIDLMEYAGGSVVKRLAPVLGGVAVVAAVIAIVGALRRKRRDGEQE